MTNPNSFNVVTGQCFMKLCHFQLCFFGKKMFLSWQVSGELYNIFCGDLLGYWKMLPLGNY